MIITRYLIREVALPLVMVTGVLVVIFISYNVAIYTADAAAGLLPVSAVARLTLLRSLIAIEVLLPAAFYLAVVMSLGRMHSDNEMVALRASGYSEWRVMRSVLWLSLTLAVIVASLSLVVRPWAYQISYHIKAEAEADFNLDKLEAGQFYTAEDSSTIIFVEHINRLQNRLEQVYFYRLTDAGIRVISAAQAWQPVTDPFAAPIFKFVDGTAYQIDQSGKRDLTLKFNELTLLLDSNEQNLKRYRSKAASTSQLASSEKPQDLAEFQWRLTTPFTTLLLGVLAVPLSYSPPRSGRYAKTVTAVLIFAVFYIFSIMAKNWVEQGTVGAIPGVWWPNMLLGLLIVMLMLRSSKWSARR